MKGRVFQQAGMFFSCEKCHQVLRFQINRVMLEINFKTGIYTNSVIFCLHGAVWSSLIIT